MKKLKSRLGLGILAAAFLFAIGTSQNANAFKYYRWAPGQTIVNPSSDCDPDVQTEACASIYNDDDTPTGGILNGLYLK